MTETATQVGQRILAQKPRSIEVHSPEFAHGRAIPREFTGLGDDVSPPLEVSGLPEGCAFFAIVVEDPDAPRQVFTHWTVWNMPASESRVPKAHHVRSGGAVEGRNDFGNVGWNGPKPPSGTHRYFFRVFALDGRLDLAEGAAPAEVWRAMEPRVLAWGETMGTFTKP